MNHLMKVVVTVTAQDGTVWSGEAELSTDSAKKSGATKVPRQKRPTARATGPVASDLKLPVRAFLKTFASESTAAGKFALILAQLTQGATGKEIDVGDIEKLWRQNSGVLGGPYQPVYGTRSKEKGWVNSPRRGVFVLMDGWQKATNG